MGIIGAQVRFNDEELEGLLLVGGATIGAAGKQQEMGLALAGQGKFFWQQSKTISQSEQPAPAEGQVPTTLLPMRQSQKATPSPVQ